MRITFKRQASEKGLARVCQSPRGVDMRVDGVHCASIRPAMRWPERTIIGWYWYGMGQNTAQIPAKTMDEAKEQAKQFYLESIKPR